MIGCCPCVHILMHLGATWMRAALGICSRGTRCCIRARWRRCCLLHSPVYGQLSLCSTSRCLWVDEALMMLGRHCYRKALWQWKFACRRTSVDAFRKHTWHIGWRQDARSWLDLLEGGKRVVPRLLRPGWESSAAAKDPWSPRKCILLCLVRYNERHQEHHHAMSAMFIRRLLQDCRPNEPSPPSNQRPQDTAVPCEQLAGEASGLWSLPAQAPLGHLDWMPR